MPNEHLAKPAPTDLNPRRDAALDFADRDYGELSAADYEQLGFMAGLEVHQQLDTRSKLFCRCPAGRRVAACDAEVLRHMRPTLSELGEYDGTALMEFKTRKEIVYELNRSTVCTYEIDDTPPFEIDPEAVAIAVEMALRFDLNLVSELHVMRKQYLDGSIPTGFQRTAMVGLTGARSRSACPSWAWTASSASGSSRWKRTPAARSPTSAIASRSARTGWGRR